MISIDEGRCNNCGLCVPICVRKILQQGETSVQIMDPGMCLQCGHCKAVCPTDAPQFAEGAEEFKAVPSKEEIPAPVPFFRFLRSRRSLRLYQARPVEEEKLKMLVEAGRFAPTGGNRQACEYVLVNGRKTLDRVCDLAIRTLGEQARAIEEALDRHRRLKEAVPEELAYRQFFPAVWDRISGKWKEGIDQLLHHAPSLVIIHMKQNLAATPELDAGIASTQMILMAETMGLGTCYIGFLITAIENSPELKEMLKIPAANRSLVAFTVGYPDVKFLRLVNRNRARTTWIGETADETGGTRRTTRSKRS
jgi:nitroreductase/NAD-dependent dihydropyrimidine dehydrogenase PreA subunit